MENWKIENAGYQRKSSLSSSLTERGLTYEDYDGTKEEPKERKKIRSLFKLGYTIYFRIFVISKCRNA